MPLDIFLRNIKNQKDEYSSKKSNTKHKTHKNNNHNKNNKRKSYCLGAKFNNIHFTQREAECMVAMRTEKTSVKIGEKLNLSPRTIEFYLQNMKKKVGCRTKKELLVKVLDSDFFTNFNSELDSSS